MNPRRLRERTLLVVLLTLLTAIVVFVLAFVPQLKDVRQAWRAARAKRAELTRTVALVQRGEEIEHAHAAAAVAQQNLLVGIPQDPAMPELLAGIGGAVEASGVALLQITFAESGTPTAAGAGLMSLPLQAKVRGSYERIRSFVAGVEDLPRAAAIDRLVLSGTEGGIVAEFALRALYLPR